MKRAFHVSVLMCLSLSQVAIAGPTDRLRGYLEEIRSDAKASRYYKYDERRWVADDRMCHGDSYYKAMLALTRDALSEAKRLNNTDCSELLSGISIRLGYMGKYCNGGPSESNAIQAADQIKDNADAALVMLGWKTRAESGRENRDASAPQLADSLQNVQEKGSASLAQ